MQSPHRSQLRSKSDERSTGNSRKTVKLEPIKSRETRMFAFPPANRINHSVNSLSLSSPKDDRSLCQSFGDRRQVPCRAGAQVARRL